MSGVHITGSSQQQNASERQRVTCAVVHFSGLVSTLVSWLTEGITTRLRLA